MSANLLLPEDLAPPALPSPALARWQPLRLGLVDLFYYDSEEFWFKDGHLLLRGNNGTGKSKVLSLTMPLLFDAQLKPSRVEPDGDGTKKMAWNLLLGSMDRRIGYTWIEFGRKDADGTTHFLTLGAGLSAVAARPRVDSWFFIMEGVGDGPRVNQDLWLTNKERVVLTRAKLEEQILGRGHVFDTGEAYRRAVDERLFRLGKKRYDALIDTLIQLRQPQLSKKPDESLLSSALSEALPPIQSDLLSEVATALGQLEDDRHQLEQYETLFRAVGRFEKEYRAYAGTQARRQARGLRQANTEFDNASKAKTEAQGAFAAAQQSEREKAEAERITDLALTEERARLDALQSHPTMQDANRLEQAQSAAQAREQAATNALAEQQELQRRLSKQQTDAERAKTRFDTAKRALSTERVECMRFAKSAAAGNQFADSPLASDDMASLVGASSKEIDEHQSVLRRALSEKRASIKHVRSLLTALDRANDNQKQRQDGHDEAAGAVEDALLHRAGADEEFRARGQSLVDAWTSHFSQLEQLKPSPEALASLAEWVANPADESPTTIALRVAQREAMGRLAEDSAALKGKRASLVEEQEALRAEQRQLETGIDPEPTPPQFRDPTARANREGAPFWKVVDFAQGIPNAAQAGLEAALQASGILDAWVSPAGDLRGQGGEPLNDLQLIERPAAQNALTRWLSPSVASDSQVPHQVIERLLESIACSEDADDDVLHETWVSPSGNFRLGALAGKWTKDQADFIGFSARAAARARRLEEIARRLALLLEEEGFHRLEARRIEAANQQATVEWSRAPSDSALKQASLEVTASSRQLTNARAKLVQAEEALRKALDEVVAAKTRLADDAADLGLPPDPQALDGVEAALESFSDRLSHLFQAVGELRLASPLFDEQNDRVEQAAADVVTGAEKYAGAQMEATVAKTHYETLRASVGVAVDELRARLAASRVDVQTKEKEQKTAAKAASTAGQIRAVAEAAAASAEAALQRKIDDRAAAVLQLQRFAESGMLAAGAPEVAAPDTSAAWTVDPALTLARRLDHALGHLRDDEETWSRLQRHISLDFAELQRALSAIGYLALAEQTDFGQVVAIIYQNRNERPDKLHVRLEQELLERKELLTANERKILENHLQAEIAAEVQRLLKFANDQVIAINAELHKRPTSTGVRFKLDWIPLSEQDGAPVGLEAAREKLLNVSSDLWTKEDRRVVGAMLQQRIAAERERADAGGVKENAGGLQEQLARALDYRRWHRFGVMRSTPRGWTKLTGPASSGERALGLTVPLFAAVASFYGDANTTQCPRLILLDEVFAGIDDAARAHCWALIREFGLDFIITSEREWACSSELPGVSICQLLKKENIDAVFVSRWEWDGSASREQPDPNRRFES